MSNNDFLYFKFSMPLQSCLKIDDTDISKTISTRYNEQMIAPVIELYVIYAVDNHSQCTLDVYDINYQTVFKKFIFESHLMNITVDEFKSEIDKLVDEVKTNKSYIKLIEFIRENYERYQELG